MTGSLPESRFLFAPGYNRVGSKTLVRKQRCRVALPFLLLSPFIPSNSDTPRARLSESCTKSSVRPLVCRLHPVEYTERRITGLASECPSELLPTGVGLLENLCMNLADAEKWRLQLYAELRHDWTAQPKAA